MSILKIQKLNNDLYQEKKIKSQKAQQSKDFNMETWFLIKGQL